MASGRPLPIVSSALIGRTDEVTTLRALLTNTAVRLVTLTGPPGVGKTRLAVQVASLMVSNFDDGIACVDLGPVRDPAQVPAELARGLGLSYGPAGDHGVGMDARSGDSPMAGLTDQKLLLVVDNFEHLLDAAYAVGDLLERLPGLSTILVR